jgi:hypothetical protein
MEEFMDYLVLNEIYKQLLRLEREVGEHRLIQEIKDLVKNPKVEAKPHIVCDPKVQRRRLYAHLQ